MKSKHAWYEIKAQAGLNEADVFLYAEIGEDFWGDGSSIGARDFAKDLAALNVSQINLRINSPGGDVFDGRNFIKTAASGGAPGESTKRPVDVDLDIKLGAVVGFNGEALRGIDLYKIESRPVRVSGQSFGYVFYLDFAGNARNKILADAIGELQHLTTFCRCLGSYPVDLPRDPQYRRRKK